MRAPPRILVVRPDRIGDFVLTVPMIDALRELWPEAHIDVLLSRTVHPLHEAVPSLDGGLVDPGGLFPLAGRLRDGRYDLAVFPFGSLRHALAARLAGIPRRIGNGLRAYSALFTDRVPLHRSRPPVHEVDYCLALLEPLGVEPRTAVRPRLLPPARKSGRASMVLADLGVADEPVVLVHPGGGGSAGRPAPELLGHLARVAADATLGDASIIVTEGPGEAELARLAAGAAEGLRVPPIADLQVLLGVLARVDLVLAGSTGVLHMAAAVGTPVLGFYPLKASQTAARWGPRAERAVALSPPVDDCDACSRGACTAPGCFERIPEEEVAARAHEVVRPDDLYGRET